MGKPRLGAVRSRARAQAGTGPGLAPPNLATVAAGRDEAAPPHGPRFSAEGWSLRRPQRCAGPGGPRTVPLESTRGGHRHPEQSPPRAACRSHAGAAARDGGTPGTPMCVCGGAGAWLLALESWNPGSRRGSSPKRRADNTLEGAAPREGVQRLLFWPQETDARKVKNLYFRFSQNRVQTRIPLSNNGEKQHGAHAGAPGRPAAWPPTQSRRASPPTARHTAPAPAPGPAAPFPDAPGAWTSGGARCSPCRQAEVSATGPLCK